MFSNDLKFFTNEPNRDLYHRFTTILKNNTQFFDILVGYFRTSGFFRLYEAMESVEKVRVLVGLNVDKFTVDIIDQAFEPTINEAKEAFSKNVEIEFENSETTSEIEEGVHKFIEWLKSGKLEMRMYTKNPIHAKVYIMRKDQEKSDYYGCVITGSSNFSKAGLVSNLEFNVELKDSPDVHFALDNFERLWQEALPIENTYIEAVEKKTWLRDDITPYEIYLKTLYEFFGEEINSDKDMQADNLLPRDFMRLQYQIDAVLQAKKTLQAYNGVFLSDVVGLGKTYICAMLAKSLGKGKKLVICPPLLIPYWNDVLLDFDVAADVESLGKLDKILKKNMDYEYVFIDEAHRFRNSDNDTFSKLHEICYGRKVILVSATPINNYASDIENQIYLFQPKRNSSIVGVKNLESFFANIKATLSKFGKDDKKSPEYIAQISRNSELIRDKVLRHIMIRRTRTEIQQYYKSDLDKNKVTFPKVGAPKKIIYTFNKNIENIFNKSIKAIQNFTYARYKPVVYLNNKKGYTKLATAQSNIGGFMKGLLVKRLESSFYAFRMTLKRFIESYEDFIKMYESKNEVWISKKVDVYDLLDSGDTDKFLEMIEDEKVYNFKVDEFDHKFIADLNNDLFLLKELFELWETVASDPKLEAFKRELAKDPDLKGNKKIIFTESKETAEYLERELRNIFGNRVVAYSSSSTKALKADIEDSFDPKKIDINNDKYDVLITTDVLAEGVNLHRSNVLINYDLPWNPTRIMQRVGRINRVGTEYDQIFIYNIFPTDQSKEHMPLEERIHEKLQAFHDTLGDDYKYLSDNETISSQMLFEKLNSKPEDHEESISPELEYLAIIRDVRDNNEDLFERIKNLPKKSKTGRRSEIVECDSTISFIRKGALKNFFITGNDTKQISFMEAVKYLRCNPDEKRINIESSYYGHLGFNNLAFDTALIQEDFIEAQKINPRTNDSQIIKRLRSILKEPTLTNEQEEVAGSLLRAYQNGDIPQNITKNLASALKENNDNMSSYFTIVNVIPERYRYPRKDNVLQSEGAKQVILSIYLKENTK